MKKFILAFSIILFASTTGRSQYYIHVGGGAKYNGGYTSGPAIHFGIGYSYNSYPYSNGNGYPIYVVYVPYFYPYNPPPNYNYPPPNYNYPPPNNNCAPPNYNPPPDNNEQNKTEPDNNYYSQPNNNYTQPDDYYLPPVYNSPQSNSDDQLNLQQQYELLKPNPNDPNTNNNEKQNNTPKKVWVAPHWKQSNDGPVWIEGYWKKTS